MRFLESNRLLILMFWGIFALKGFFYISVTPIFEGFDEPWHYSYIQEIAEHKRLPHARNSQISLEIRESFSFLPMPPFSGITYTHQDYWNLPKKQRILLRDSLKKLPKDYRQLDSGIGQYEAQHPPLYYLICAPIYFLMSEYNLIDIVFSIRLFSVIMASFIIPFGYLTIRKWFQCDQVTPIIILGIIISMPVVYFDTARIGNDSLGVPLFTVMLLLCGTIWNGNWSLLPTLGLAIILGFGLLTKTYFLAAVPPIIALFILKKLYDHTSLKNFLNHLIILFFVSFIISGWWYIRNYINYGTFLGLIESITNNSDNAQPWYLAILKVNVGRFFRRVIDSHLWPGHWSFIGIPKHFDRIFRLLFILGISLYSIKIFQTLAKSKVNRENIAYLLIFLFYFMFWVSMYYHTLQAWNVMGHIMTGGWYLCAVIIFEVGILVMGYSSFIRVISIKFITYLTILLFFIVTETYGIFFRLLPFYSGFGFESEKNDFIIQMNSLGFQDFINAIIYRLTWNKPEWISIELILILNFLILTSSVVIIVAFIRLILAQQSNIEILHIEPNFKNQNNL